MAHGVAQDFHFYADILMLPSEYDKKIKAARLRIRYHKRFKTKNLGKK